MRLSPFTIAAESLDGREAVLLNGCTGAVDVITRAVWDRLRARGPDGLGPALASALRRRGHLVEEPAGQEAAARAAARRLRLRNGRTSGFFLVPTYACQLRCSYCCQQARWSLGLDDEHQGMSIDMAERALEAIRVLDGPARPRGRSLTLYGGEPLQASTRPAVERVVEHAAREGYRLSAVTNGVEARAFTTLAGPDRLAGVCFSVHGRLDERRWRRLADDAGAFLAAGAAVAVRFNVDALTIDSLEEGLARARRAPWFESPRAVWNVCPILPPGDPAAFGTLEPEVYAARILDLLRRGAIPSRVEVDLAAGRQVAALLVSGIPSPIHPRHPAFCGSRRGLYVLDAYGLVFGCHEAVRDPSSGIGRYVPSLDIDRAAAERQARDAVADPLACATCPYVLLCGGGCVHRAGTTAAGSAAGPCRWMAASVRLALVTRCGARTRTRHESWL